MNQRFLNLAALAVAVVTLGATDGCKIPAKQVAGPTAPGSSSPIPGAIATSNSNNAAAISAVEKRGADAAASVAAAREVNATQPPGQPTTFVDRELGVASANLPPPAPVALAAANERKLATLSTNLAQMEKLYGAAQSDAEASRKAAAAAATKASEAAAALVTAERSYAATLEKNRAENQAAIDAANRKADEAIAKARDEQNRTMVHIFVGLGVLCILAGIGLAVASSGTSVWRSSICAGCGVCCFGVARLISHPWFWPALGALVAVFLIGGGIIMWRERKQFVRGATLDKLAPLIDERGATDEKLAAAVGDTLDESHKAELAAVRRAAMIRAAKDALKSAKKGFV